MRAPTEPGAVDRRVIGARPHPHCVVCGASDPLGLGVRFTIREDGSAESQFHCSSAFEGYPHQLHGGVIALLLDGAMTNCLFAHGHQAVTAELRIRYREPVATSRTASVRAWIERSDRRLRVVAAELVQDGQVKARARAKFVDRRSSPDSTGR